MARFVWSDAKFNEICEQMASFEKEQQSKHSHSRKRASTMELFEQICREDQERDYFKIVPPQTISLNMLSGNQVIGILSVTKAAPRYILNSTNNLIPCCDCYNYFSIHAPACPFCGCPATYIALHYYKVGTENFLKQARVEAAQRKREEEKQRKELEIAEARRQAAEKRRQEELVKKQAEQERKRKEEERFRARVAEIREICKKLSLPDRIIKELATSSVDDRTLRVRVDRILYYQSTCPELGIQASQFITNDDIGKYVSRHTVIEYDKRVDCIGDCSTCRRDECVLTKRR